jgi:protein-tyrosine phosphatase
VIDLHAHLLPQIDDGPADWEEALSMLEAGAKDGIRGVVCTSHVLTQLDADFESRLLFKFEQLERLTRERNIPIRLWLGAEIHVDAQFDVRSPVATLANNHKTILLELPLNGIPNGVDDKLFRLSVNGIQPVLAHPERNSIIAAKPSLAYRYVQRGILIQVNAGSLTGLFGRAARKTALTMLDHHLVHFVASDCHNLDSRPMALKKAYKVVAGHAGEETARKLFIDNPAAAVRGEEIAIAEPLPIESPRRRFGLW